VIPIVGMRGIVKRFGDVVALDGVDLALQRGEIHALLGENGAGTIAVEGEPVQVRAPRDALRRGIGMVHQHFELVPQFTVLENVILGREGAVWLRRNRARAAVQQLAAQYTRARSTRSSTGSLRSRESQSDE